MDILAETYLKYSPKSITELIGKKGINQRSMREVSIEDQTEYGRRRRYNISTKISF